MTNRPLPALITAVFLMAFASSCNASVLADRHTAKSVPCSVCHETDKVESGAFVENERCLACHGPLEVLQNKYETLGGKNPHKNHLGEIECTLCHKGHQPSESYCMQCHKNFSMPMKE